jgi:tRNA threonylcarbamoyl adenosine modification protein YeaZ/ribosomal-protein-alanine acetyltransferase
MVLLALETATRRGSVALGDDTAIHSLEGDTSRTHGARLPEEMLTILAREGRSLDDVTHGVIVAGPGSFTGLRVGMAAMQGLAFARGFPVVPVPTLDAMAEGWMAAHPGAGVIVTCLDSQRGDVFIAAFETAAGTRSVEQASVVLAPMVGPPQELARRLNEARPGAAVVIVGEGARRYEAVWKAELPGAEVADTAEPVAASAIRLARRHLDWAVTPDLLRPLYLRRPEPVMARERAQTERPVETTFTIKRATGTDDLARVEALQRDTFTNPWGAEAIKWELEHTDVARLYLMTAESGELVAYCACWMIFDELHINSLAVGPAWRRRGLARRLLQHVFHDAVPSGARAATLEVRSSNDAARRLYEGLGFAVEGVRRDYYQHPREDALILWQRRLADALVGP